MPHSTFPGSCSSEEEGTQQQQQQQQEQQPPQPEQQQQDQEHQDQEQRQRQQSLSHLVSPTPTPSSYTSSPSSSSTSSPFNSSTSSPVLRPSSPATLANINTSTSTSTSTINTTTTTTTTTDTITTNTTNQQPPSAVTMTALAPLSSSHQSAFFKLSTFPTPSTKRSLPQKHIRSKSTNTLQSYHPFSTIPSSFSRPNAPPLLRSTSLPPINSFAELSSSPASSRFTLTTCPPSPISPRTRVPRSNSPTRQWAYSQSPRGSGGVNYHSGSAFSHSPPPSYLVNEPYVASSSSGSSTPTSVRSRSPSISSLETIPDSPDAEAEEELRAKEELAAAVVVVEEEVASRRGSGRRAAADKRKRWSVCGGEKRGDLELETIWEDGADALGISVGDGMGRGEMI